MLVLGKPQGFCVLVSFENVTKTIPGLGGQSDPVRLWLSGNVLEELESQCYAVFLKTGRKSNLEFQSCLSVWAAFPSKHHLL